MSRRRLLAATMARTGLLRVLEVSPSKPGILIFNYHRIGNARSTRFDRGVFSATVEELDTQLGYLKNRFPVVSGEELAALVSAPSKLKRMHVAMTFDDGYLDNYTNAFEVFRAHNTSGMFFLVPEYVGTAAIPWWDEIAYLLRNTNKAEVALDYPVPLRLTLAQDREAAILSVLRHYKRTDNRDGERLLAELRAATSCTVPPVQRRFLDWDEARAMRKAGMTIGSHTQTHRILAQLAPKQQLWELEHSRREMETNMGTAINTLAYPVGSQTSFSETTEKIAWECGYRMIFSFYGGENDRTTMNPMNLRRRGAEPDMLLFRAETAMYARFGRVPY